MIKWLNALRDVGAILTLVTVWGIMIAMVSELAPEIFTKKAKDGTTFQCSDSFLQHWLHDTLNWSERHATRAAQKMPDNWENLCQHATLWMTYSIKEQDIPSCLYMNSDQTQVVLLRDPVWHGPQLGQNRYWLLVMRRSKPLPLSYSSQMMVPCSHSKPSMYGGLTKKSCPEPTSLH